MKMTNFHFTFRIFSGSNLTRTRTTPPAASPRSQCHAKIVSSSSSSNAKPTESLHHTRLPLVTGKHFKVDRSASTLYRRHSTLLNSYTRHSSFSDSPVLIQRRSPQWIQFWKSASLHSAVSHTTSQSVQSQPQKWCKLRWEEILKQI